MFVILMSKFPNIIIVKMESPKSLYTLPLILQLLITFKQTHSNPRNDHFFSTNEPQDQKITRPGAAATLGQHPRINKERTIDSFLSIWVVSPIPRGILPRGLVASIELPIFRPQVQAADQQRAILGEQVRVYDIYQLPSVGVVEFVDYSHHPDRHTVILPVIGNRLRHFTIDTNPTIDSVSTEPDTEPGLGRIFIVVHLAAHKAGNPAPPTLPPPLTTPLDKHDHYNKIPRRPDHRQPIEHRIVYAPIGRGGSCGCETCE